MRAFRVAYDGRPFYGFQRQPDVPTVEDAMFDALRELGVLDGDAPDGYAAAGRTDAGVSAVAQTVAFACPDWCTPAALDGVFPPSIRAWAAADVPDDFHATHDAVSRTYTYHCYAPAADDARARAAASALAGEHDFHNLTPDDDNTVRTLDIALSRDGDFLVFTVSAGGFARELVRRAVALVHAVATGDSDVARVDRVLGSDPLDGSGGVGPAPATPLVLTGVDYPGVDFTADEDALAGTREIFGEKRVEGLVAARVAGTILDGVGG
ncbi:tRNA pseudouridine(38-40) synthase TruA [Salinirarus marinus]|uniref:tRNA pseudouridine(38-40) synthase TruA n=1 Tax=Salinirarus marinus TaxID=3068310 RepID=UPI003C6C1716